MYKQISIWIAVLATIAIVPNSESAMDNKDTTIPLTSGKVLVKIIPGKNGQIRLNYLLDNKEYPSVILQATLKDDSNSLTYDFETTNKTTTGGRLTIIDSEGDTGSLNFNFGEPQNYLHLSNFKNINTLKIDFSSDALLLPDQIGNDLVIYPENSTLNKFQIPAGNYRIMNMLNGGNAIFNTIWNSKNIDLSLSKTSDGKHFGSLVLKPVPEDNLWLGLNVHQDIWYKCSEKLSRTPIVIGWQPPFPAVWQLTMQKKTSDILAENGHCDSWMLARTDIEKPLARRMGISFQNSEGKTWASNLGGFIYPFMIKNGHTWVHFPNGNYRDITYNDKFTPLIYPIEAEKETPNDITMPASVLDTVLIPNDLKTLYTEKSDKSYQPATCGITEEIEMIFYREEDQTSKDLIVEKLRRMNLFVAGNRERIEEYITWSKTVTAYLKRHSKSSPDSENMAKSIIEDLFVIEQLYLDVRDKIKTPTECQELTDQIIALIDSQKDAETKEDECKLLGRKIRTIGGKQDHLVAMMRTTTKILRMRTTTLLLENKDPRQRQLLEKIRQETAAIMHTRFPMEGK